MSIPWRRLVQFGGLQVIAAIAPLAVLPLIVNEVGQAGWVGLSIGYGVGAAASILVALGWPAMGPALIAATSANQRAAFYFESLITRGAAFLFVAIAGAAVCALVAPEGTRTLAVAMAISMSSWGLTPSWYYIGVGSAGGVLLHETLPRLLCTGAAIPLIKITGLAVMYPGMLITAAGVGLLTSTRNIQLPRHKTRLNPGVGTRLKENSLLALSALIGAGYTSLAVPIVSAVNMPLGEVSSLSGAFRMRTLSQFGTNSMTTALQGWVVAEDEYTSYRRRRAASSVIAFAGVLTAILFVIATPWAADLVFVGVAPIDRELAVAAGVGCIPIAISSTMSFHWLAPLGQARAIAHSRLAAAGVGAPTLLLFGGSMDAASAVWVMTFSECVVCAWCFAVLRRKVGSK